eukprot:1367601-Prymnesium_polylepis.1
MAKDSWWHELGTLTALGERDAHPSAYRLYGDVMDHGWHGPFVCVRSGDETPVFAIACVVRGSSGTTRS